MKSTLRILLLAVATLGVAQPLYAADVLAASCDRSAVQLAIDTAVTGDRVLVPAGSCTWTSGVVLVVGKHITLQGAGATSTVITISGVVGAVHLSTTASRVTGFGFVLTSGDRIIVAQGHNFRVDHNRFDNQVGEFREAVLVPGDPIHPTGLIDSNDFRDSRVVVAGDLSLLAHAIWSQPSTIGNSNQAGVIYVEDNTFVFTAFGNAIDSNYGGRYVFRHNTLTDVYIEAHSVQGENRAPRSWEIYDNVFNFTNAIYTSIFLRGGTGVVFNNTIAGPVTNSMVLDNVRSWVLVGFPPGPCDGFSPWDGNTPRSNGWPCRDQIGRGMDSPGPFPQPQAPEPAYFWGNMLNGAPTTPTVDHCDADVKPNGTCADVVEGRDYFASVARLFYVPFIYPHPQRAGDVVAPPPPPPPPPPPTLDDVISAVQAAVSDGTLVGDGHGRGSAKGHLAEWLMMLRAADRVSMPWAKCGLLHQVYVRIDGQPIPPDFVRGPSAADLAEMIAAVLADEGCEPRSTLNPSPSRTRRSGNGNRGS